MSKFEKFSDTNWLHVYGLSRKSVLDYFYISKFYDASSNNEIIRNERIPNYANLLNMTGLEFELDTANMDEPHLFVIKKQIRKSPETVELMECMSMDWLPLNNKLSISCFALYVVLALFCRLLHP
jgi:hypothetical protein